MESFKLRSRGKTGIEVTPLGCGGATLGDLWEVTPEAQAEATIEAAYEGGIHFFDTAPWYGLGKSEHRMGRVLRTKARHTFVLTTKVGRVLFRPQELTAPLPGAWAGGLPFDLRFDYSRHGSLRSYEDSLQRLGLNTVDALL